MQKMPAIAGDYILKLLAKAAMMQAKAAWLKAKVAMLHAESVTIAAC